MKTTKILFALLLTVSLSTVFGQVETTNQKGIQENGVTEKSTVPKQTQGATFGERKGWDGSVKGNKFEIIPADGGITVIFPNDIAYKIDDAKGSVKEVKGNTTSQNRVSSTPIRGIIVKGGKNPGGQMRGIDKKDIRFYELPVDWTDGSYSLQISYESETDETTSTETAPSNNAKGKTKGKVVKAGGNFILEKKGTTYAVSSVSSLAGAGGGAAAASYAKTVQ